MFPAPGGHLSGGHLSGGYLSGGYLSGGHLSGSDGATRCADVEEEGSSLLVAAQTEVPLRTCRGGFPGRKGGFRAATQTGWANGPCRGRQAFVGCFSRRRLSVGLSSIAFRCDAFRQSARTLADPACHDTVPMFVIQIITSELLRSS